MKLNKIVHEFLGIEVETLPDEAFKFTQTGLIQKVSKATHCENVNPKPTPTNLERPLVTDKNGAPPEGKFKYDSVNGMLMYLAAN